MSKFEKLIKKFKNNPQNCRYLEIEKILCRLGCEKIEGKGSHVLFKFKTDICSIPLHNNDCKDFYKEKALKFCLKNKLI